MIKDPEFYKSNVQSLIGLGPIARITKSAPTLEIGLQIIVLLAPLLEMIGVYDIDPYLRDIVAPFCGLFTETCALVVGFIPTSTI